MNKKGYTLVELIGVIVLLAIILTLVSTGIVRVIKSSHKTIDDATKTLLFNQASSYLSENETVTVNGVYSVSISDLIRSDKISSNFLNNYSADEITTNSCIIVNYNQGIPSYEFKLDCSE